MRLAEIMGIQTVPHALIKMNDEYAYITRRIDREISEKETKLYAMEDFCQLSYRLTQDKYKGSYEQCGRIIKKYSATPGLDLSELFLRVVGSFVMGNSDMHLENFSLKETEPGRILWDPIKFCGTYDEKSMLIKGKTFYTDRRILLVSRAKRATGRTYFKKA